MIRPDEMIFISIIYKSNRYDDGVGIYLKNVQ